MANTIESTTDEALLRSIIDGSITEFEDDTIITLSKNNLFLGLDNLTNLCLPNLTTLNGRVFNSFNSYGLPSLKKIDLPNLETINIGVYDVEISYIDVEELNLPKLTNNSSNHVIQLEHLRKLKKVFLPKVKIFNAANLYVVNYIVLPSVINMHNCRYCTEDYADPKLKGIDLGESCTTLTPGSDNFFYQTRCQNIEALILRGNTLVPLTKSLSGAGGTQNFGQSSTNHIYVPSALVNEYKAATNWSAYSDIILPIEGSKYEYYYADGTPLGFENTSGMIAYYDVGNVNDWDSETKTITSHVENDFNAWRQTSNNQFNINNAANIPTNIYDNCYMNGGFIINFGDGTTSNISIEDKYDAITIEFLYASSSNAGININKALTNESLGTQIIGYIGRLDLAFKHIVLELSKTGTKLFINKVQKRNINDNNMNRPVINIANSNNCYIGHVAVWNRELTSEEIAQHYDYYVANFHVGETAFDSSGNFIAGY